MPLEEYSERIFFGTWRVCNVEVLGGEQTTYSGESEIAGTELTLEEGYDVRWKIPDNVEPIPLFSCESYEVILTNPAQITFLSSSVGRIGFFTAEFGDDNQLHLTYDKSFVLYCEKVPQSEQIQEAPFSFLSAWEKGYFSDLVITSSSGKNHHVHKVIMKLACPEQNWDLHNSTSKQSSRSYQACVFDGLSNQVLATIFHYVYTESLPSGLTENSARECLSAISKIEGLGKLETLLKCYLENYAVRTQIEHLCDEIENCGRKINGYIRAKPESSQIQSGAASLWNGIKHAIKEFAVAFLKSIQICKLFSDHRNELSREERHRIMKHCLNRLPNLLVLTSEFSEIIVSQLNGQSDEARKEFASYILTEAEPFFDVANQIISDTRKALEAIINSDVNKRKQKESVIAKTLRNAVHIKELAKLKRVHRKMVEFLNNLLFKREHFALLTREEKIEAASNVIECASDEIPVAVERMRDCCDNHDSRLSWPHYKYTFKFVSAKVAWTIEKSQYCMQSLSKTLKTIRKLVQHEDFDAGLASLGLIDNVDEASTSMCAGTDKTKVSQDIESLCISPGPRDSILSSRAEQLFSSLEGEDKFSDMRFIVHCVKDGMQVTKNMKAHRVIVACRCDWFRRALSSGMKEDIKREINIYDCNPDLFKQFLRYLYTGRLDCSTAGLDILADMIALADQYEVDSLKSVCEGALKPQIMNENVLELLSIGEQFNAAQLRECCMDHIIHHPELLESEVLNELPPKLQIEIRDLTEWNQKSMKGKITSLSSRQLWHNQYSPSTAVPAPTTGSPEEDLTSEMERIDQLTNALHLRYANEDDPSDDAVVLEGDLSASLSECSQEKLNECIDKLRNILGHEIPVEELSRIAQAAVCDLNRALNYYFGLDS